MKKVTAYILTYSGIIYLIQVVGICMLYLAHEISYWKNKK